MRDFFKAFLLSVFFVPGIILPGFCGVGNTDERFYIEPYMWEQHPYRNFVLLRQCVLELENQKYFKSQKCFSMCSAQYIAPNLILSAAHCVKPYANAYVAENYKGQKEYLKLLDKGQYTEKGGIGDWAIFLVEHEYFYSDDFFNVKKASSRTKVLNAGWGTTRILSEQELKTIREIINGIAEEYDLSDEYDVDTFNSLLEQRMSEKGIEPLEDKEGKLKASECEIVFENMSNLPRSEKFPHVLATTCDSWSGNSGGGYISLQDKNSLYGVCSYGATGHAEFDDKLDFDYMTSADQFMDVVENLKKKYPVNKTSENAAIKQESEKPIETQEVSKKEEPDNSAEAMDYLALQPKNANSKTTALAGDESSKLLNNIPFYNASSNTVENKESEEVANNEFVSLPTQTAVPKIDLSKENNGLNFLPLGGVLTDVGMNNSDVETGIEDQKEKVEQSSKRIKKRFAKTSSMTNKETLSFVNDLVEYKVEKRNLEELQQVYEEAKSKEQSLANRALTALSVAAAGIGGMQLAQGLAEQKADKVAEQDMDAYIATFRCTYGSGKQVKASSEEIELPGGNDANLMKYRNEYFTLAADLKERKNALGMKPGIESEEILDKTQMGLYDDENLGITDGVYSSIYRAKMLDSEKDKTQIEEDKNKSKNRVVGGGVAAGVGVAGGMIGNSLINGELGEKIKNTKAKKQ